MEKIKAIIFDLNGIFIQSPKLSERFRTDFEVDKNEFLLVLKDIMAKVRMPQAENVYLLWKSYLEKWNVDLSESEFLEYWFEAEKENVEMTSLARKLKEKGIKLFILSNNFRERAGYYAKNFPFLNEVFEKVYYSWQTGFIKPDERCFELILEENGLQAEECFYFDDSEHNIEIAKSLGFKSYLFQGAEQVDRLIKNE